jgi:hypothetical protein
LPSSHPLTPFPCSQITISFSSSAPQSHSSPTHDLQFLCSSVALSSTHCFLTSNPSPFLSAYPDFSSSQSPASATILPDPSPFYFPASVFSMHYLTLPYLHAPMLPRFDLLDFHPPASTSVTQNLSPLCLRISPSANITLVISCTLASLVTTRNLPPLCL